MPSSYRPISLLDTTGKLFEKLLLSRILYEVSGRGLLRHEQFGLRFKHSTALQLARLVAKVSRNFDKNRLTGAVFLDVAKAFDTVWVGGVIYKLIIHNFPLYFVKTISSYLNSQTFEASIQTATLKLHSSFQWNQTLPPHPDFLVLMLPKPVLGKRATTQFTLPFLVTNYFMDDRNVSPRRVGIQTLLLIFILRIR